MKPKDSESQKQCLIVKWALNVKYFFRDSTPEMRQNVKKTKKQEQNDILGLHPE